MTIKTKQVITGILLFVLAIAPVIKLSAQPASKEHVKLAWADDPQKVNVFIDGKFFTSYWFPSNFEKPVLYPIKAPDGAFVTRGFPFETRPGERIDHPHHVGLWFNYGDVNGLDFWNNSSSIPANKKDLYGHIAHRKILEVKSGSKGVLEVQMDWLDNHDKKLLTETTRFIFSGDKNTWTVDRITRLTAVDGTVTFSDNKEGLIGLRVDRAFEMPATSPVVYTDANGNPTTVAQLDNKGVTGMYTGSNGLKGDAVWGTKNDWVILNAVKDNDSIGLALFDHPRNIGYPAYSHARGYGLFAMNNLGCQVFDPKKDKKIYTLDKDQSFTFYHRFVVHSGSALTAGKAQKTFLEFSKEY